MSPSPKRPPGGVLDSRRDLNQDLSRLIQGLGELDRLASRVEDAIPEQLEQRIREEQGLDCACVSDALRNMLEATQSLQDVLHMYGSRIKQGAEEWLNHDVEKEDRRPHVPKEVIQ